MENTPERTANGRGESTVSPRYDPVAYPPSLNRRFEQEGVKACPEPSQMSVDL
jgi:hypothetical protein